MQTIKTGFENGEFQEFIIKEHDTKTCPTCNKMDRIISFGMSNKSTSLYDTTEVFYWCPCGYKWIENSFAMLK